MEIFNGNISHLIFKANINQGMGKVSVDTKMLEVLSSLDGSIDSSSVARLLKMSMFDLRIILVKLYKRGLIVKVKKNVPMLDSDFMAFLKSQLADIMGPITHMLIMDTTARMGVKSTSVPFNRAAELIDILSSKIPMDDKREAFREAMLSRSGIRG